jgi:hypothetical protein
MVKLSVEAVEEKVRYAALEWLHGVAEKEEAERARLEQAERERRGGEESEAQLIEELRILYAKALPEMALPGRDGLQLEAVVETPGGE